MSSSKNGKEIVLTSLNLDKSLKVGPEVEQDENIKLKASKEPQSKELVQSSMKQMESKSLSEFKRGMWIVKLDKMASNDHL